MKWLIIAVIAINVSLHLATAKSVDKGPHHKKASSAKPTKTPKSIVEQFRGLPSDDLAFIEELDKQFQLHGEKVKIKVERDNTTQASGNGKNSKRTIDGSLSYGYHHNPHHPQHQQFYFSKPRYEIYPYSQEDIPAIRHTYAKPEGHTTVEIQQSQAYEIKEVPQEYPAAYGQNYVRFPGHAGGVQQLHPTHEEVPVIVLKVPGPSKYAAHLKTLLQQYLEIRAAQVIRELEQQEHVAAQLEAQQFHQQQQQQQQQQHYRQHHYQHTPNQGLQTHVQYATPASVAADHQAYQQYQNQVNGHTLSTVQTIVEEEGHRQPVYGVPSSPAPEDNPIEYLQGEYEASPQAGHTVYEDHQTQYIQNQPSHEAYYHQEQQQQQQEQTYHHQPQQQQNHHQPQQNQHQGGHIMYVTAEPHQPENQQYIYAEQEQNPHPTASSEQHSNGGDGHASHLETQENYPDEKHTRVVFTKNLQHHRHQEPQQHHHQVQPEMVLVAAEEAHHNPGRFRGPIYLPTPGPDQDYDPRSAGGHQQQQQQPEEEEHIHTHHQHQLEEYQAPMVTPGPFITITQKRKMNRVPFNYHAHGRISTPPPRKRETPFTEDQFNKFNKLVNRLKKKQMMVMAERTKKSPPTMEQEQQQKQQH